MVICGKLTDLLQEAVDSNDIVTEGYFRSRTSRFRLDFFDVFPAGAASRTSRISDIFDIGNFVFDDDIFTQQQTRELLPGTYIYRLLESIRRLDVQMFGSGFLPFNMLFTSEDATLPEKPEAAKNRSGHLRNSEHQLFYMKTLGKGFFKPRRSHTSQPDDQTAVSSVTILPDCKPPRL